MHKQIEVLDHGYVRLVETPWGSGEAGEAEAGIIEAARQSTQGSVRGWDKDAKLLAHLYRNNHATPFEFAGMVVEIQAPIFVFREWHRHRTQSYNEMSARYAPMPNLNYNPDSVRVVNPNTANKQANAVKGADELTNETVDKWRAELSEFYAKAEELYQSGLALGVPKELARLPVPVGRYSRMRASANLRNWLAFITLRAAPEAQWEIQQYANAVSVILAEHFPQTWELFNES